MAERDLSPSNVIEAALFAGALAAAANRERAHLDGELGALAIAMLHMFRPRAGVVVTFGPATAGAASEAWAAPGLAGC